MKKDERTPPPVGRFRVATSDAKLTQYVLEMYVARSETPPVKYAEIHGSNVGRNFHWKCKIKWKFVEFA